ncbi:MAG: exodeoxyribonuclease VII large subunit [Chlorobi bacterium]|nr:exodeoxyribonuclease VII large subunit [Chlorobiota bacterium]
MNNYISLSELNLQIKEKIENQFSERIRIVAEISELRESRGHAYIELSEKSDDDTILAKARATVWARTYGMLKSYFESSTGHRLEAGLKVLIVVQVVFHEIYGFSLNVIDIDPTYTIGEIERKRLLIIKRLEEEGVTEMNKELDFPLVPQRIAVISSETAAGLGDFKNQLLKSPYKFHIKLFNAAMQGEETENSVVFALDRIFEEEENFDIVVIIRGGGAKSDLAWFDSYNIAVNIAQFPLPVVTGIGHERDMSISDLVAHYSLNTPTAVAEFLIDRLTEFYDRLEISEKNFFNFTNDIISYNNSELTELSNRFKLTISKIISENKNRVNLLQFEYSYKIKQRLKSYDSELQAFPDQLKKILQYRLDHKKQTVDVYKLKMISAVNSLFENKKHQLEMFEQENNLVNPIHILKSGYSYTLKNGKLLKSCNDVQIGDLTETVLLDGKFMSEVKNK